MELRISSSEASENASESALVPQFVPTYGELRSHVLDHLKARGVGHQQVLNRRTALNAWQKALGLSDATLVGLEFGASLDRTLERFYDLQIAEGLAERTVRDRVEHVLWWQGQFRTVGFIDCFPEAFSEALQAMLLRVGLSARELSRLTGIHRDTLVSWLSGRYVPRVESVTRIRAIERALNVPPNTLVDRLGMGRHQWYAHQRKTHAVAAPMTRYGQRIADHNRARKQLKADGKPVTSLNVTLPPTPLLQTQWLDLIRFKTDLMRERAMAKNTWRTKTADRVGRRADWSAQVDGLVCPTAGVNWSYLGPYLGWLALAPPDGLGIPSDQAQNLVWLVRDDLVMQYVNRMRRRSDNIIHTGIATVLNNIRSMLRPETGWVWLSDSLVRTAPPSALPREIQGIDLASPELQSRWRTACESAWRRLGEKVRPLREPGVLKHARPPEEPIRAILARDRPLDAVLELISLMQSSPPPSHNRRDYPTWLRDLVLMKMMVSNPLRVGQFAMMTYRPDNSGNVYQTDDGRWRLRFDPEDFKNEKGAANGPYDVQLPQILWKDIQRYLTEGRPLLRGATTTDAFFLPWTSNKRSSVDRHGLPLAERPLMWDSGAISTRIAELVIRYLPDSPPFRAHSIRHIVATDHLKRNPGSYLTVAKLLHDRLSTVIKAYQHLEAEDGLKPLHDTVNEYFGKR